MTAADLVSLPPLPAGVLPACYYRGANGWIPAQGQGATKQTGYTDLAAASLSASGVLTIKREIDRASDDGGQHSRGDFKSTTRIDFEGGTSNYHFDQNDTLVIDAQDTASGSTTGSDLRDTYNVTVDSLVSLQEAPYACPYPSMTLTMPPRARRIQQCSHRRRTPTASRRMRGLG